MENQEKDTDEVVYDAKLLTARNCVEMLRDHSHWFGDAVPYLKNAYNAVCYDDAEKALMAIVQNAGNAQCITFARKNNWLSNKGDRKTFMETSTKLTTNDKETVCQMYDIVGSASNYTNEVLTFFRELVAGDAFRNSFSTLRFDEMLQAMVEPHDYGDVDSMFFDFDKIYAIANDASIFEKLKLSKSKLSIDEIQKRITDYLNEKLYYHHGLGMYMPTIDYMAPQYINKWRAIDRVTGRYWIFADSKSEIQKALDKVRELNDRFDEEIGSKTPARAAYGNSYTAVFFYLEKMFVKALEVIDGVPNLTTEAYKVFRYSVSVRECVAHQGLGEVNDPLKTGTHYNEFIAQMPKRLTAFVKNIAKMAPQ